MLSSPFKGPALAMIFVIALVMASKATVKAPRP